MILVIPAILAGLFACWWNRRRAGQIRLNEMSYDRDGDWMDTLQSIPFYVVGVASAAWAYLSEIRIPYLSDKMARRRPNGYRAVLDDDAALLDDYDN